MSKSHARSDLYRLIAVGQEAHRALLAPLVDRGLSPGDDVILLTLAEGSGHTISALAITLELDTDTLQPRLERLVARDLITPRPSGPGLEAHFVLTERGQRFHDLLEENWRQLEHAVQGGLHKKQRKLFAKTLARALDLLRR